MHDEALFGRWLQRRRKSLNLTQEALASLVGCSSATIRKLEADERRPSRRVAQKLAESLGIPAEEREGFLRFARGGWSDDPPPAPVDTPLTLPWRPEASALDSLPTPLTLLLGREREAESVVELLLRKNVRLLTLTGPGGSGKTRLALEAARRLNPHFPHGAHCTMLAAIEDPQHVPSAIARLFAIQESGSYSLWDKTRDYLRERQMLLLLDNFEQIIDAAPLVAELLEDCPGLRMLVTSRQVLRLAGEQEFPVPPLEAPSSDEARQDPASIGSYSAVELFVQRASEARPDFALTDENRLAVAEVCSMLDGLPLAIELAAARIRLFSPQAMLGRLSRRLDLLSGGVRNAPERQKTMRQTIAWSFDLLDEAEKKLQRRISVFSGGFTLEAAEAVANGGSELLSTLGSLVEKSLVRPGQGSEPRFTLLETVREYGIDMLVEHHEEAVIRNRHAAFFVELMEGLDSELRGPRQARWMRSVENEHADIRSALRWSLDSGADDMALRLASASWWYWYVQGHLAEGREFLREALEKTGRTVSPWTTGALIGGARLAARQNDDAEAQELYVKAEHLARALDDDVSLSRSLQGQARVATHRGDFDLAERLAEEALAMARRMREERDEGLCLNELGEIARSKGDYLAAAEYYEQSLGILAGIGDKVPTVSLLSNLGYVALRHEQLDDAESRFLEGMRLANDVGDLLGIATTLAGLAGVASFRQAPAQAAKLFGASEAVHEAGGLEPDPVDRNEMDRYMDRAREYLTEEEWTRSFEEGRRMKLDEAIETAQAKEVSSSVSGGRAPRTAR